MRKAIFIIGLFVLCFSAQAQIDGTSIPSIPQLTTAEMASITSPNIGSSIFNTDDQKVYSFTTSGWITTSDDQTATEVNSDTPVDVDGDGNTEATVEDVIQDIAPITSASGRIFYPPSIAIDASTNVTDAQINLYTQYTNQFNSGSIVKNSSAGAIPIYAANELDYYVTYYDPAVFANITITNAGLMEYDIIGQPSDYNSLINVVFVVK